MAEDETSVVTDGFDDDPNRYESNSVSVWTHS